MATTHDFLMTGCLGAICPGMTPDEVRDLLGAPDDCSVQRTPVSILRYGNIELSFGATSADEREYRLVAVAIRLDRSSSSMPPALRPEDWTPATSLSRNQFLAEIADGALKARSTINEDEEVLDFETGASAVFVDGQLHSLHFRKTERPPERRQVTVALPVETVQVLKRRAHDEHVSVQTLLERLIKAGT